MVERVLIVDDDPVQRRLVESIVGQAGYETAAVDGGEAALKAMLATASTPYDCVVLDLVMPDLDGLGVLVRMREARLDIPVIVQAADGGIDNVVTAIRAGAVDFVVKPVGFERLSVSLRNAMVARVHVSREFPQIAAEIGDFDTGHQRTSAKARTMLAPIDDVGARQLCEPHMGRSATEVPLLPGDGDSAEHIVMPTVPPDGGSVLNLLNDGGNIRGGHRGGCHQVRARTLPWSNIRGGTAAAHRPINALS